MVSTYHLVKMVIWGMVYYCFDHITPKPLAFPLKFWYPQPPASSNMARTSHIKGVYSWEKHRSTWVISGKYAWLPDRQFLIIWGYPLWGITRIETTVIGSVSTCHPWYQTGIHHPPFLKVIPKKQLPWRMLLNALPSGKRLHNYGKSPFLMGKSTLNHHVQ